MRACTLTGSAVLVITVPVALAGAAWAAPVNGVTVEAARMHAREAARRVCGEIRRGEEFKAVNIRGSAHGGSAVWFGSGALGRPPAEIPINYAGNACIVIGVSFKTRASTAESGVLDDARRRKWRAGSAPLRQSQSVHPPHFRNPPDAPSPALFQRQAQRRLQWRGRCGRFHRGGAGVQGAAG